MYGLTTNTGICVGIMLAGLVSSAIVPVREDGIEILFEDQSWRIVYGFPIMLELLIIAVVCVFFPYPSIQDELKKKD